MGDSSKAEKTKEQIRVENAIKYGTGVAGSAAKDALGRVNPEDLNEAAKVAVKTGQGYVKIEGLGSTYLKGRATAFSPREYPEYEAQRRLYEADKAAGIPLSYKQYPLFDPENQYVEIWTDQERFERWAHYQNQKILAEKSFWGSLKALTYRAPEPEFYDGNNNPMSPKKVNGGVDSGRGQDRITRHFGGAV